MFSAEPLALDLRGIDIRKIRSEEAQNAVATLAAPIHGKSKEELLGLELRLRRRRRLLTAFAALMIALFGAGFIWKGLEAQNEDVLEDVRCFVKERRQGLGRAAA